MYKKHQKLKKWKWNKDEKGEQDIQEFNFSKKRSACLAMMF